MLFVRKEATQPFSYGSLNGLSPLSRWDRSLLAPRMTLNVTACACPAVGFLMTFDFGVVLDENIPQYLENSYGRELTKNGHQVANMVNKVTNMVTKNDANLAL
ncbi:hypothetical protein TNCV_1951541 [Trichonephila clavipes]|nr:hypothetical protein TNCV_1951541 [Trichonephila clavipes]